jgi:two-component system chemotaxis response regulator CheY
MALRRDLRILVVDDMAISRQLMVQMLERIGIGSVTTANSGAQALTLLNGQPADLVICDLDMPGMDGLALLRRLRDDRRFCRISFILTGVDDGSERIAEAWHAGMDRFLPKPFDMHRLVVCLEALSGRI